MQLRRSTTKKIRATLDMTPMIDVTFQLIIFFLLSSTFVIQSSVPVELSQVPEGAVTHEKKQLTITLQAGEGGPDNKGGVYVDETPIGNWQELRGILKALQERDPEALVLIRPDRAVPTERLLYVMGMANALGLVHYGVAAESPVAEALPVAEVPAVPQGPTAEGGPGGAAQGP